MNNRKVAERFVNGKTTGTGSHFFIEGDTLYSYGHHFPVARRERDIILVTMREYSNSTARHKSHLRTALCGSNVQSIDVPAIENPAEINVQEFLDKIDRLYAQRNKTRTTTKKYAGIDHQIGRMTDNLMAYRLFKGVK